MKVIVIVQLIPASDDDIAYVQGVKVLKYSKQAQDALKAANVLFYTVDVESR
jgi:hypothetical protein